MFIFPYKIKRICTKILRVILIFSVIASLLSVSCLAAGYYGDSFSSLFGTPIVSINTANDGTVNGQVWYRDIVDTDNNITYEGMEVSAYTAGGSTIQSIDMMFVNGDSNKFSGTPLNPSDMVIFTGRIGFSTKSALPISNFDLNDFKIYFSSSELVDAGSALVLADSAESKTIKTVSFDALDGSGVDGYRVCWLDFSVQYQLPTNHAKYTYPQLYLTFSFDATYSSWTCFFFDDIQWYLGDKENAPLYPSVDDSSLNDVIDAEDKLMGSAQEGLDVFTDHVQMFTGSYFPNSGILGAIAGASAIVNVFVNKWEWLEVLLNFSLCLGVIMIVFGIVDVISSKASQEARSAAKDARSAAKAPKRVRLRKKRR